MKRNGFTLIEMLVVVVIIAILAGIVFRLIGAGGASSDRAITRYRVEQLANAIEEYRAEYGKYPPVSKNTSGAQPMAYDYPLQGEYWAKNASSLANTLHNIKSTELGNNVVFGFGLMSYLVPRVEGRAENAEAVLFEKNKNFQSTEHHWLSQNTYRGRDKDAKDDGIKNKDCPVKDSSRDKRFADRARPYLKDILSEGHLSVHTHNGESWTNTITTVRDAWDHDLHYKSDPPYDSFRVWSDGPDGKSETADDIIAGREN